MSKKISVIMPCYNAAKTVIKSIQSLERQSYKNFELIIIDDGSKDDTVEVVEKYLSNSKMEYNIIKKENGGVSSARNAGLEVVTGELISFLDSDDIYDDEFFSILIKGMEDGEDTSFCSFKRITDMNFVQKTNNIEKYISMTGDELRDNLMYRKIPTTFVCYLFKASIIKENGFKFRQGIRYGEDTEFLWKYLSKCSKAKAVSESLYYYYDNPMSATNNVSWDKVQLADSILNAANYMKECKMDYYDKFMEYMYPRTLLAIYKAFIKNGKADLSKKFASEYDLKKHMKALKKSPDIKIKGVAICYGISPFICEKILKFI